MSLPGSPQHNYELAVQHWLDEQNRQAEEELRERQRKEEARRKEKERQRKKQAKESLANEDTEEFIGSSARLDIALNYKITHLMLIAGGVAAVYYAYPLIDWIMTGGVWWQYGLAFIAAIIIFLLGIWVTTLVLWGLVEYWFLWLGITGAALYYMYHDIALNWFDKVSLLVKELINF